MNELNLTIPADSRWLLALRSSLSAVGAIAGLSLDTIEDMRIAVDEAFDLLAHQPRSLEAIMLICNIEEDKLNVRLEGKRSFSPQQCVPADAETARLVIGTLVADIHLEGDSCGIHSVYMTLPVAEKVHGR